MGKSNKGQVPIYAAGALAVLVIILAIWFSSGDKEGVDLPSETTSEDIIPENLLGYSKVETDSLISKAPAAVTGAAVLYSTAEVQGAYEAAKITDDFIQCYQDAGAIVSSGFYKDDEPILGGVIVVGDSNQIKDPKLLSKCAIEVGLPLSTIGGFEYEPCVDHFTLETKFNSFYVMVVGTDASICVTLRDSVTSS